MTIDTLTARTESTFHRFDAPIERFLGADLRMIYGFGVPIVVMSLLIIAMILTNRMWVMAATLGVELVVLAVVLAGFITIFDEPEDASPEMAEIASGPDR